MDGTPPARRVTVKLIGVAAAVVAVVAAAAIGLVVAMGAIHDKTVASDVGALSEPVPKGDYYLSVYVKIVALDLDKETVGLQLECIPKPKPGALVNRDGQLKVPVVPALGVAAEGTQQTKVIPAGGTGGIVTVALGLDGNVEEYPGDRPRPVSG